MVAFSDNAMVAFSDKVSDVGGLYRFAADIIIGSNRIMSEFRLLQSLILHHLLVG